MDILNIKLTENEVKRLLFVLRKFSQEGFFVCDHPENSDVCLKCRQDLVDNIKNLIDVVQIQLPKVD